MSEETGMYELTETQRALQDAARRLAVEKMPRRTRTCL